MTFRCGHPRTPENSYTAGQTLPVCRTCRRQSSREWYLRKSKELRDSRPEDWMSRADQLALARRIEFELRQVRRERLEMLESQ